MTSTLIKSILTTPFAKWSVEDKSTIGLAMIQYLRENPTDCINLTTQQMVIYARDPKDNIFKIQLLDNDTGEMAPYEQDAYTTLPIVTRTEEINRILMPTY